MFSDSIVIIQVLKSLLEKLLAIMDFQDSGDIKLVVIGAMGTF